MNLEILAAHIRNSPRKESNSGVGAKSLEPSQAHFATQIGSICQGCDSGKATPELVPV